ncbi:protein of unknown function [Methylorubrum extorquens]|uniref:Uncharacterized protein n=1 Tax=Methylorubrum extorquens TaxID=408 RepID=A0A2N9ALJ7_METEX|nr:protein of unknown function [Methylorubrum extorquens]
MGSKPLHLIVDPIKDGSGIENRTEAALKLIAATSADKPKSVDWVGLDLGRPVFGFGVQCEVASRQGAPRIKTTVSVIGPLPSRGAM